MRINDVLTQLERSTYPSTPRDLARRIGHRSIELPNGDQHVSEAFEVVGIDMIDDPDEAKLMFLSGLDSAAIGRKGYSDRDPPAACETNRQQLSL